ncbi:Phosphoglycerate mutase family protein [Melia azedarach]|uniref:Phosphoglycerate mutase family protein n=1 Tax=Melia azedarach TaxID=155640 RepID=A0ACC1YVP7_MELAZ|nr:Phosphoglycerate mutase family protein [Melia azedarach]
MDSTDPAKTPNNKSFQSVIVIRHGDRADNFEPLWALTAARPWDPHLIEEGRVRAFCTGRRLRANLGFPIHRVFVSPFLRCIQTAFEVISALCAVKDDSKAMSSKDVASLDPSKIKVSIEYGLCEVLNKEAIRNNVAPKDGNFGFNTSELEALLPAGTVDNSVKPVYEQLPQWEEPLGGARERYEQMIKALANKYPSENLLLVTHGEAVGVAVSAFLKDVTVYEVDYCAYAELRRPISIKNESFSAGDFEVLINPAQTGIQFLPSSTSNDGTLDDHHA